MNEIEEAIYKDMDALPLDDIRDYLEVRVYQANQEEADRALEERDTASHEDILIAALVKQGYTHHGAVAVLCGYAVDFTANLQQGLTEHLHSAHELYNSSLKILELHNEGVLDD